MASEVRFMLSYDQLRVLIVFPANQNTHIYGRLDEDGIWRDPKDGSLLEDMGSTKGGSLAGTMKGLVGAVKRVQ
jgi:hypothetical protein